MPISSLMMHENGVSPKKPTKLKTNQIVHKLKTLLFVLREGKIVLEYFF